MVCETIRYGDQVFSLEYLRESAKENRERATEFLGDHLISLRLRTEPYKSLNKNSELERNIN